MSFLSEYGSVIIFYAVIIAIIYLNRKKFDFQGKIIAMYRTKIGIKLMHKWGEGAEKFIKSLALIGVYVGFAGILLAFGLIIDGWYKLLFVPEAPATFAPVLPGVKIPGVDIFVPFWYGIIALFITIVVHEFCHGVVAAAHKIKVKHSGFVMFGPLPGAFVEPDEKQLGKASRKAQLSVYAAGPFSNILLTIILIILFGFTPLFAAAMDKDADKYDMARIERFTDKTSIVNFGTLGGKLYEFTGMRVISVEPASPAALAGLRNDTLITVIDGHDIKENITAFAQAQQSMTAKGPGETVTFGDGESTWAITLGKHPENESKGYVGIHFIEVEQQPRKEALEKYGKTGLALINVAYQQLFWIILLSSGIGLANLLPLGPVDGGRMFLIGLERFMDKKKAHVVWNKVGFFILISVLILLLAPIIKNLIL